MENIFTTALINLVLAFVGLAIYSLWDLRKKIRNPNFSWKGFRAENKNFWIWAISMQILLVSLIAIAPEAGESITILTGMDFRRTMAFATSGLALSHATNIGVKTATKQKQ